MAHDCEITARIKATQETVFRIATTRLPLRAIEADSGIPYGTLRSYAGHNGETAVMSLTSLNKLIGVIPDDLLSLLLPDGRQIVRAPESIDHDELCEAMQEWLAEKARAHHPDSPGGREIAPCEDNVLRGKFAAVKAAA